MNNNDLHELVDDFADRWGPNGPARYQLFVTDLRALLEAYGKAALAHGSLPDTEHEHGASA